MERLETAVASAREEASEARRRERETRSELGRGDRQARSETAALRAQLASGREDERRAAERREGRIASFEATIGELRRELEEAERTVAAFRGQVQQARRERAAALRVAGAAGSRSMPRDPIEMGRFLDEVAAAARRFGGDTELAAGTPAEFRLPAGVAPDRREAVEWLVRQPVPFALIVDGYNVTFQIGAGSGSGARRRLSAALGRMRRAAASASRVILVFDSAVEPAGSVAAGPGGIEVRFSSEGRSADEEIVALAGELGGAVVVISSDREVRDRAEHHGALCLWGEALAEWLRDRA
jgi:predicted RNA-binding protein with PIN domain